MPASPGSSLSATLCNWCYTVTNNTTVVSLVAVSNFGALTPLYFPSGINQVPYYLILMSELGNLKSLEL